MSIRINGKKYINGTIVRANPVEEATGTLEKIGIGSDVYEIQGSGGGSGYDVNDYYLQDGQISDGGNRQFLTAYYDKPLVTGKNYIINFKNSVDGAVVGTVLFKYTSDFTTYMSGGGSIGTITMIITSTSITSSNYTGSWQNIYVDVYREISSAEFYHPVIYSTEEREIGVWTDNKPLYQKTIVFNNVSGNRNTLDLDIPNVEFINLVASGSQKSGFAPLPYVTGTDYSNNIGGFFDIQTSTTYFEYRAGDGSTSSGTLVLTVRYTKTTDTAGSGSYNTLGVPTVHYTTDEQVIGTWVDGKPLYEKTIITTSPSSTGSSDLVTLTNVDIIIKLSGIIKTTGNITTESNNAFLLWYRTASHPTNKNKIAINLQNSDYINSPLYVTVQYTKTTD